MGKAEDYLTDLDKKQQIEVTDPSSIPDDATFVGDTDGDGHQEFVADTDGDGALDTVIEIVTGFFG